MGIAPISDIKSFFNSKDISSDMQISKTSDQNSFARAMTDASSRNLQNVNRPADEGVTQKEQDKAYGIKNPSNRIKDHDNRDKSVNSDDDNLNSGLEGKEKAVGEKLEKLTKEIRDGIKEELNVSDEELEQAMAELGLVPTDLLNTDNVKNLMLELSGETDAMALVTNGELFESINNITELVNVSLEELENEFGITEEQLEGMIALSKEENPVQLSEAEIVQNASAAETKEVNDTETEGIRNTVGNTRGEITDREGIANDRISPDTISIERKMVNEARENNAESNMQNAMEGQNFSQQITTAENVEAPNTEFVSSYVDNDEILRQVTDNIKLNINGDTTTMELQLHPASLGTVNVSIASTNGVVTANLQVQNESVKAVLESQLQVLLQTFEEQGQKVEAIEVSVAGYDLDRSLAQGNENREGNGEDRDGEGIRTGRVSRRRLNLNELDEEDIEELTQEEQLAAEMMAMNGQSIDYTA
ncbi:MAG: flagellar hook-length control protein FliK [Lachnospiraceae bacterium]|nr:flagellar hook-length control protein FliK [Lachnospiraceae bacterium]